MGMLHILLLKATTNVVYHYNMINLRSELRRKLLAYYFTNPTANHYLRELATLLGVDAANLSRELAVLQQQGCFISEYRGNQKYIRLNRRYPLYEEVRRIILKTIGVVGLLQNALREVRGIDEAYLYGSFARNQQDSSSDIDVLIIGEVRMEELERAIRKTEKQLGREISYTILSRKEFRTKRAHRDPFLEDLWHHRRIPLISTS
jgi:predicted nucleotidyltransferase